MCEFAGHSWARILMFFCGGLLFAHAPPATGQTTGNGSSVSPKTASRWLKFDGGAGLGYGTGIGAPSAHLRGTVQFGRVGLTSAIDVHVPQTAGQLTRGRLDFTLVGRYEWPLGRRWSLSPHFGLDVARSRWTRKAGGRERSETNVNLGAGPTVGVSTEYKLTRRMDLHLRISYRTAQQNQWSFQGGLTYTFAMQGRGERCPRSGQPVGLFSCESCPCADDCTPTGTREILQTHMGLTTSPRYTPEEWKTANVMVAAVLALTAGGSEDPSTVNTAVDVSEEWAKTFVKIMKHKRVAIWVWFDYRDCESSTCCDFLLHCPNTNEWNAKESEWKLVRAIDQDWNALHGKKKEGARVWPGTSHPQWDGQFGEQLKEAVRRMKKDFRQK